MNGPPNGDQIHGTVLQRSGVGETVDNVKRSPRFARSKCAHLSIWLHREQLSYSSDKAAGKHARARSDVGDNRVPIQLAFRKHHIDSGRRIVPTGMAVIRGFLGKPVDGIHHFPSAKRRKNPLSSSSRAMLKSVRSAAFNSFASGFWAEISSIKV